MSEHTQDEKEKHDTEKEDKEIRDLDPKKDPKGGGKAQSPPIPINP